MNIDHLGSTVKELLRREEPGDLKVIISRTHPADLAAMIDGFKEHDERRIFFSLIEGIRNRAQTLARLSGPSLVSVLEKMEYAEVSTLIRHMGKAEAVHVLRNLPQTTASEILHVIGDTTSPQESALLANLLQFDYDTAGGMMTSEVIRLEEQSNVTQAMRTIQSVPESTNTDAVFVIDSSGVLRGVISMKDLARAKPTSLLSEIMKTDFVCLDLKASRNEVMSHMCRYQLKILPVVDQSLRLMGAVSVGKILYLVENHMTESLLSVAGLTGTELLSQPVGSAIRQRVPALLLSCIGGLIAWKVISHYNSLLLNTILLAGFIPLVLGLSGQVATQCALVTSRALGLKLVPRDRVWGVVGRQSFVGFVVGLVYAILVGAAVSAQVPMHESLGVQVGCALLASLSCAAFVGTSFPIILERFGFDPVIASGPSMSMLMDVTGVLIYFNLMASFFGST